MSEQTELDVARHALDDGVLAVFFGAVVDAQVDAEEAPERLPEAGAERAEESFDDIVAALVGLALDEFAEHLRLALGEFLEHGLILLKYRAFHFLEVGFALFLRGERLDVFVGLEQRGADELGVGECLLDVAHGAPVEFLVLAVAELDLRL